MIKRPSKKVLSIFIVVVALVVAVIITFGRDKASSVINYASNLSIGDKISIPENPNWQNELDKVGVDSIDPNLANNPSGDGTLTDTVAVSLVSNYLALKQNNTLDQTSAQELIDQTLNYIESTGNQVTRITQLNVVPDNGMQSIGEYGENLGNVLRNNKPEKVLDEREIINAAISSRDPSIIAELGTIIAVYEVLVGDLVKMPVPNTFVKAHLDLTNGANGTATALKEVRDVFDDPFRGLQAIQLLQEGATIFTESLRAIRMFIGQNQIIYKQGSGGYYLFYGI